ncbi:MAG: ABC transporter permease [Clostridia bacterium]|nr:ABC transporter permease [Clostridia bacterium]
MSERSNPAESAVFEPGDFEIIGADTAQSEGFARRPVTYWGDALRRFRQNKLAVAAFFLLILLIILSIAVPLLSPYDYSRQDLPARKQWPSADHWFGTDDLGRDLFTRVWQGGRVSIAIGVLGALIVAAVGCVYGGIAAYFGGWVDMLMMRIVEILSSVPNLLVIIMMSIILDSSSIPTLLLAMTITGWCPVARLVRSQMLQISRSEYVMAARVMGVPPLQIVLRHMIPNTLSLIIVNITFRVPGFIFSEAFLSYVGLGVQPPNTSWGALASAGQANLLFYPYMMLFPSLFIALTMLCFTLMGDGLRDALDPKLRR